MSIRIGIVARNVARGGVALFLRELLQEIDEKLKPEGNVTFLIFTPEGHSFPSYRHIQLVETPSAPLPVWDEWVSWRALKKNPCDLLIYPKTIIPWSHHTLSAKKAIIIHDLGYYEKNPRLYPLAERMHMKVRLPSSLREAAKIWAVSEFTLGEVERLFPAHRRQIQVLGEGVSEAFFSGLAAEPEIIRGHITPFFFYAGDASPRKNLRMLLLGFQRFKTNSNQPARLVITGIKKPLKDLERNFTGLLENVTLTGYLSEPELRWCYRNATALVYPSLYEGFGLPLLEAQAARCLVLASNIAVCRETSGGLARFFNPKDPESIAAQLREALEHPPEESWLVKAQSHAQKQTWSTPAERVLTWAYEEAGRTSS
jgi:glycosyltransferase involved in cell wall biosynthesis